MADKIRLLLEDMLPDVQHLVKRGYFTYEQARDILKTREYHEYSFMRQNSAPKDFLKAIEYEYKLERQRRKKKKNLKSKLV